MAENILYIGPYREFSGAGNAARNYIQALFQAGHDVCIAPIYYTGDIYPDNEISSEILPLENNYLNRYDIVIQHCHPFDYVYSNKFEKNIGIYQFNTADVHPAIGSRLQLMNDIVVNSQFTYNALTRTYKEDISKKIKILPELIDTNLINHEYIEYPWIKEKNRPIVFYTLGDFIDRKNITTIIKAFIYTFSDYENVELVIKTKPHYSDDSLDLINKQLEYYIDKTYKSLKMKKNVAKQPKIMIGKFNYEYLLALHKNCNVYIDASMGESFGYSVLEAALFNNYLIVNENSSTADISDNCIKTNSVPVFVEDSYTANFIENTTERYWYSIDFDHLCKNMMKAYCLSMSQPKIQHNLSKYEYGRVGDII